jgi:hypothetical protein
MDAKVTTVTLVNPGGSTWNGTVSFRMPGGAYKTTEWMRDVTVSSSVSNGQVAVSASVPPYDVRVYAIERTDL